jgi:hypothetical protein
MRNDNIKLNDVYTVKIDGQVKMLVVCKLTKIYQFYEKAANKAGGLLTEVDSLQRWQISYFYLYYTA